MSWDELIKVALIGTDRSALPKATVQELFELGVDIKKNDAQVLLKGSSLLSIMQRAGGFPKEWQGRKPNSAPQEKSSTCSRKSRNHLHLILHGDYPELLPEFIFHLTLNNKILPADLLPELLDQSTHNKELWTSLKNVIGKRGQWLIQQNPDWVGLSVELDTSIWETGTRQERVQLLEQLRQQEPAQSITLIRSTWDKDDLQSKTQFVKTLEINPSINDESFLEECLDNSRKEIRKPAAKILSQIAESQLCKRVFDQLVSMMEHREKSALKKEKLSIQLPEDLTEMMIRDGIDPSSRWFKGGVKASRFGQMIAIVPPDFWENHFNKTSSEALHLFTKTEWSELLLQGLTEATIKHRNMNWAEAILLFWLENFQKTRWQYFNPIQIFNILNEDVFNKVAIIYIKRKNSLVDEESPLSLLLRSVHLPWQDTLSKTFINALQKWIAGETSHYWSGWHLRPILKKAAIHTNPKLFDLMVKGWSTYSNSWSSWNKDVEQFLSVLKFRKDMIEGLKG